MRWFNKKKVGQSNVNDGCGSPPNQIYLLNTHAYFSSSSEQTNVKWNKGRIITIVSVKAQLQPTSGFIVYILSADDSMIRRNKFAHEIGFSFAFSPGAHNAKYHSEMVKW